VSLFAELKRRNVFRVGIFYVVSAWLVIGMVSPLCRPVGANDFECG